LGGGEETFCILTWGSLLVFHVIKYLCAMPYATIKHGFDNIVTFRVVLENEADNAVIKILKIVYFRKGNYLGLINIMILNL